LYSATPLGVLPPAFDRAGHRDELRDARREPGIGAERLRDVREWPERDEGAVAVECVEQQPSGTARVRAATHLGQVQHREVVDRRRHSSGKALVPRSGVSRPQATGASVSPPSASSRIALRTPGAKPPSARVQARAPRGRERKVGLLDA